MKGQKVNMYENGGDFDEACRSIAEIKIDKK